MKWGALAVVESQCEIPPLAYLYSNLTAETGWGTLLGGKFDWGGNRPSEIVTEALKGIFNLVGNQVLSANAQRCLTARHTSRADAKAGVSDLPIPSGRVGT